MVAFPLKKSLLSAAAAAIAIGAAAPAFADGGRRHGGYGYHGRAHHYADGTRRHGGSYYGARHHRRHHGHGLRGGEAALIALGVVGGIILIDRALENDRYNARYAYEPRYAPPPRDYYRRDDRPLSSDDDIEGAFYDDELAGGGAPGYAAGDRRYNYGAAYNDCKAETRDAARDGGFIIALPAKPQRIEPVEAGAAVRFTASYLARDARGGEWRRTMVCEADGEGVRFLELI